MGVNTLRYDKDLVAGKLRRWEKYLNHYRLPQWEDIPDFGLYMEQVITLLKQYLAGIANDNAIVFANTDVDGNGRINTRDYTKLKQYLAGIIENF